jgi:hypothetical protein
MRISVRQLKQLIKEEVEEAAQTEVPEGSEQPNIFGGTSTKSAWQANKEELIKNMKQMWDESAIKDLSMNDIKYLIDTFRSTIQGAKTRAKAKQSPTVTEMRRRRARRNQY